MIPELSDFSVLLLFFVGSFLFIAITLFVARLIRPSRPGYEKETTYECGEDPSGTAWGKFNVRYYVIALIFILFEVELIYLFPWAIVFGNAEVNQASDKLWGWFALAEMFVFIGILLLGLIYVWAKGYLNWVKPQPYPADYQAPFELDVYDKVNEREQEREEQILAGEKS